MATDQKSSEQRPTVSRKTLRLRFRVSGESVELVSTERLEMITPPQFGERPEAGKHSGFWLELQGSRKRVLAHRLISPSYLNSVEVHSPDGKIERKFGPIENGVFEVFLPDMDDAKEVVLMGDPITAPKTRTRAKAAATEQATSGEIARFALPSGEGR